MRRPGPAPNPEMPEDSKEAPLMMMPVARALRSVRTVRRAAVVTVADKGTQCCESDFDEGSDMD